MSEINEASIFANRLNYIMSIQNITNAELGRLTFMATSTIAGYRSGKRLPNIITLKEICRALNVSADYLIGISNTFNSSIF